MKSVAKRLGLSSNTIARAFDHINYSCTSLPEVLSIDEFKGNSDKTKYHCSIVDPVTHQLLDVIKIVSYTIFILTSNLINVTM